MRRFLAGILFLALIAIPGISDDPPHDSEFIFARLKYTTRDSDSWRYWPTYFPDNPPWHHDYPNSDEFITGMVHELTGIHETSESYKIVSLDSDEVFKYPFLYMSEPGFMILNPKEIKNLGEYIRRGGFLMADDFRIGAYLRGPEELDVLRHYLKLAAPEYDLVRLDIRNPIFHTFYDIDTLKMKAPYSDDVLFPEFWGLVDDKGRLHMIADYNNDIGEFWKWVDQGKMEFRPAVRSVQLGINYILYSMTH